MVAPGGVCAALVVLCLVLLRALQSSNLNAGACANIAPSFPRDISKPSIGDDERRGAQNAEKVAESEEEEDAFFPAAQRKACSPNDAYALLQKANQLVDWSATRRLQFGSTADWPAQWMTNFFAVQRHYFSKVALHGNSYNYTFCEIGFGPGFSALNFLTALTPDCRNFTAGARVREFTRPFDSELDFYRKNAEASFRLIQKIFGVTRFSVKFGDSHKLRIAEKVCDAWHIDGDHSQKGFEEDVRAAARMAKKKALVLLDDLSMQSIARGVATAEAANLIKIESKFSIDQTARASETEFNFGLDLTIGRKRASTRKEFAIGHFL